jgi:hypothetical protein
MNANTMTTSLKMLTCAAIAVAVTLGTSWTFVESTKVVRSAVVVARVADRVAPHVIKAAATGLLQ